MLHFGEPILAQLATGVTPSPPTFNSYLRRCSYFEMLKNVFLDS